MSWAGDGIASKPRRYGQVAQMSRSWTLIQVEVGLLRIHTPGGQARASSQPHLGTVYCNYSNNVKKNQLTSHMVMEDRGPVHFL